MIVVEDFVVEGFVQVVECGVKGASCGNVTLMEMMGLLLMNVIGARE